MAQAFQTRHLPALADDAAIDQAVGGSCAAAGLIEGDRIDFDHWLLPPIDLSLSEHLIQRFSKMAGVMLMAAAFGAAARGYLWLLVG